MSASKENKFPYIYVNDDGTARELSRGEQDYLQSDFHPGDGARPYIKSSYLEKAADGRMSGYLLRRSLPSKIIIRSATK